MGVADRITVFILLLTAAWLPITGCGDSVDSHSPVNQSLLVESDPYISTYTDRLNYFGIEQTQAENSVSFIDAVPIHENPPDQSPEKAYWNSVTIPSTPEFLATFNTPSIVTDRDAAVPLVDGFSLIFSPLDVPFPCSQIQAQPVPCLVPVSCYPDIATEGIPVGSEGYPVRECFLRAQQLRIRQDGIIFRLDLYVNDLTDTDRLILVIWRRNGDTFDRIAESENLIGHLVPNQLNEVILNDPITGVREGDFYGFRIHQSGAEIRTQLVRSAVNHGHIYWMNKYASDSNVDWIDCHDDASSHGRGITARLYMRPPAIVAIGNSIVSGHPHHQSFIEPLHRTNIEASFPYIVRTALGRTCQTMGIGNRSIGEIEERFTRDCIDLRPHIAIIEGGVKDLNLGTSTESYMASWTNMLDQCEKAGIQAIVLGIMPWTGGTNSQMIRRDALNTMVSDLVKSYDGFLFVDTDSFIGSCRIGGEPGNLWDINDPFDVDGIHLTQLGYTKIVAAILDSINHQ